MVSSIKIALFFFLIMRAFAIAQIPQETAGKQAVLHVTHTEDFVITGEGTAANWSNTTWLILPQRNSLNVSYETRFKILYSDSGIYCLYRCEDRKITASLTADFSDLFNEDVVEVFLWTDETVPVYFEYELSPLNYELPILVPNIKGNFFGWRPWHYEGNRVTRHKTQISKKDGVVNAWTAEFFIPYALLKPMKNAPPQKGTHWRANFYRIDYDKDTITWQWQLVHKETFHDYEKFGTIVFD
jgi:Carbohydrate family 9 binding domain-like